MGVLRDFFTGHSTNYDLSLETLRCSEGVYGRVLALKCISVRQQAAKADV